jgi:hypothetical protein
MDEDERLYRDRFEDDVAAVADRVEDGRDRYDELLAVVHPGFTGYHPRATAEADDGYERFLDELSDRVDEARGDGTAVAVFHPVPYREETGEIIEDDTAVTYVSTEDDSALFADGGADVTAGLLAGLADGGAVRVTGEVNGCCYTHVRQLFEDVEDKIETSYDVIEGEAFPEERLWRL